MFIYAEFSDGHRLACELTPYLAGKKPRSVRHVSLQGKGAVVKVWLWDKGESPPISVPVVDDTPLVSVPVGAGKGKGKGEVAEGSAAVAVLPTRAVKARKPRKKRSRVSDTRATKAIKLK